MDSPRMGLGACHVDSEGSTDATAQLMSLLKSLQTLEKACGERLSVLSEPSQTFEAAFLGHVIGTGLGTQRWVSVEDGWVTKGEVSADLETCRARGVFA